MSLAYRSPSVVTRPSDVVTIVGVKALRNATGATLEQVMIWGEAGRHNLIPVKHLRAIKKIFAATNHRLGLSPFKV